MLVVFLIDWEQRKLGELFSERSERSADGELIAVTTKNGVKKANELSRKDNSSSDKSNYKIVEQGDIAYNTMRMWQGASGYSPYKGILSPAYTVIKPLDQTYSLFFAYLFKLVPVIQEFQRNSQGLTSDTFNLKYPAFSKIIISTPSMMEQKELASFLNSIDQLLTLHQRINTNVEWVFNLSVTFMEKVVRDWEQRKLSEVLSISKLKNKENSFSKNDVLSVSREVGTVNQIVYQGRSFAGKDVTGYKVVQPGDLIYTKSPLKGAPYGIFQVSSMTGIISPLYAVYGTSLELNASFVGCYLKSDQIATHYLAPLVAKGAKNTINISDEGALQGAINIPIKSEQVKITNFIDQISEAITLHQRKVPP